MEEKIKKYTVYIHINKINNKKYIGITRQNPMVRWANGEGYRTQPFYHAIQEYGWDGFEHLILYENLTYEEACEIEKELISEYDTNDRNYGYNVSKGGEQVIKKYGKDVHTNKTVYQYSFLGDYIQSFKSVVETVDYLGVENIHASTNISSCARKNGNHNSAYGFIWSYEYLGEKIEPYSLSEAYGKSQRIKIYQYDLNGQFIQAFESITIAANALGVSSTSISEALDLPYRKSCEFQWRTYLNEKGIEPYMKDPNRNDNLKKKIVRISKNDLVATIYDGLSDAKEDMNLSDTSGISDVLIKNRPSAYGYFWFYYNEYENGEWKEQINYKGMQRTVYVYDNLYNEFKYDTLKDLCDNSIKDFQLYFSKSCVCSVCNNKDKNYKGYVFSYEPLTYNEIQRRFLPKEQKRIVKEVYVYDKNLVFLGKYNSQKLLSEISENKYGIYFPPQAISRVCTGDRKQYKGFIFSFNDISKDYMAVQTT